MLENTHNINYVVYKSCKMKEFAFWKIGFEIGVACWKIKILK